MIVMTKEKVDKKENVRQYKGSSAMNENIEIAIMDYSDCSISIKETSYEEIKSILKSERLMNEEKIDKAEKAQLVEAYLFDVLNYKASEVHYMVSDYIINYTL